ncbi:cytochrome c peroxidase [Chitinophaga sp. W2I13]
MVPGKGKNELKCISPNICTMTKTISKRNLICLIAGTALVILNSVSCKKENNGANPAPIPNEPNPEPGGNDPGAPNLPGTLYDYVGTRNNMPPYMQAFMNANPTLDNTPVGNPITNAGATLGRVLFYDKSLSVNNTRSCGSCHHQDKAFTDGVATSEGFEGNLTRRNSMPVVNLRFFRSATMFWDMRAKDIETQTLMPVLDHIEMGIPSLTALETKLTGISYYPALFKAAFGSEVVTSDKIAKAISQFLRSIVSFNSRYDQGVAMQFSNFSASEKNGMRLMQADFCTECHSDFSTAGVGKNASYLIVDNTGVNTGFGSNNGLESNYTDKGIGEITHKPADQGTFKIPSLRNVELTAPYMHDGRFATLEDAIEHYSTGIKQNPNIGIQFSGIQSGGLVFSAKDKNDIIAFLKTLTDQSLVTEPKYADPFK